MSQEAQYEAQISQLHTQLQQTRIFLQRERQRVQDLDDQNILLRKNVTEAVGLLKKAAGLR